MVTLGIFFVPCGQLHRSGRAILSRTAVARRAPILSTPPAVGILVRFGRSKAQRTVSTQDAAGSEAVKSVIFSLFNSSCTTVFTLVSAHAAETQCDAWNETHKAAELKLQKRAGATPLFRLSAAQKVRGVAPARRSLRTNSEC